MSTNQVQSDIGYTYESGKTYAHSMGLSCTFRQWKADSHCRFLHGYALQVTITFRSSTLNDKNWVQDFGGLKPVKEWLERVFDHKLLIAEDDPKKNQLIDLSSHELAQPVVVEAVGCEAFAKMIFDFVQKYYSNLDCVEVREHEGNFARYRRSPQ